MKLLLDENLSFRLLPHGFTIVSKDDDFRQRALALGSPPKVVWLSVENAGTAAIAELLRSRSAELQRFEAAVDEALLILELLAVS